MYQQLATSEYGVQDVLQNITRTVPCMEYTTCLAPSFCPKPNRYAAGRVALVFWLTEQAQLAEAERVAATLPAGGKSILYADGQSA